MSLEVLHLALVFLRRAPVLERAKVSSLARAGIFLAGIQSIAARFESFDHRDLPGDLLADGSSTAGATISNRIHELRFHVPLFGNSFKVPA